MTTELQKMPEEFETGAWRTMSVVESEGTWLVQICGDELWTKQLGRKQREEDWKKSEKK